MITPGLRGFVLDTPFGDDEGPVQDLPPAVLTALSQAFTPVQELSMPRTQRRVYLDTFDWRLYRAGLVLELEQARGGGRLLLTKADGTPQAGQSVTGWPPRRPGLASDLPPGPVRDRVAVLAGPRALLPVVKAASTVSVTRLLNSDGKTVARLIADRSTVTSPASVSGWHHDRGAAAAAVRGAGARLPGAGQQGGLPAGWPARRGARRAGPVRRGAGRARPPSRRVRLGCGRGDHRDHARLHRGGPPAAAHA